MSPRAVGLLVGLLAAGAPVMLAGQAGRISYESFAMPNGLRVVYSEDHSTPVVTVDLWYHAGARNERPGRSGFAHLFEHMMFQGSAHVKKSEHFQLVERAGGTLNGSTHDDYTNYYETIPSNRLNVARWLEADRMRSLAVTQENLENQRATVQEEQRLRVDNQPYAPTFRSAIVWPFDSATCFAYAHATIGSMGDLDAAKLEDVQAYFGTYYAPNNATLVVVGDFRPVELRRLVNQYFADIRSQAAPPAVTCEYQRGPGIVRREVEDAHANLPAAFRIFRLPPHTDPDIPAIELLNVILGQGESSRLNVGVGRRDRAALPAGRVRPARPRRARGGGGAAALQSVPRVRRGNQQRLGPLPRGVRGRRPARGREVPGPGELGRGHRAAEGGRGRFGGDEVTAMERVTTLVVFLSIVPSFHLSAQGFPSKPPRPTLLSPVRFPPFKEATFGSGLQLVLVEHHEQPVVSVSLSFRAGGIYDAPGKEGLAELVAELLTKGTASRSAEQLAATIEGVGGSLSASASEDFLTVSADALSDQLALVVDLLGDVTQHAAFPESELALARTRALSALALSLSQPASVAARIYGKEIYGPNPYGRSATRESYTAVTRDDITQFAAERLRPAGALLVVAGDVTEPPGRALVPRGFARWGGGPPPARPPPPPPPAAATGP